VPLPVSRRPGLALLAVVLSMAAPAPAGGAYPRLDFDFGERGLARAPFRLAPLEVVTRPVLVAARGPGGRLLVAGQISGDERGYPAGGAVARFHRDGRLDRSFGRQGRLRLYFPGRAHFTGRPATVFTVTSVTVQRNGKTILAGTISPTEPFAIPPARFGLVRLLRDGSPDTGFGRRGFSTWAPRTLIHEPRLSRAELGIVVPQPGGRLLAAGVSKEVFPVPAGPVGRLVLTRFRRDGSVDRSFGEDGEVSVDTTLSSARWVGRPHGGFVAVGPRAPGFGEAGQHIEVVGFDGDGSLDDSFGRGGTAVVEGSGYEVQHLHVDRSGGIVLAGGRDIAAGRGGSIRLMRLTADGTRDSSFGRNCQRPIPTALAGVASITVGHSLLVAAWKRTPHGPGQAFGVDSRVLRFTTRGCFDPRSPRIALERLAVGAPLRLGRGATAIAGTYGRGLALVRVRR